MAYDTIGADPFKRFSVFDFDVRNPKMLMFEATNGQVNAFSANVLRFRVDGPEFHLKVSGFDTVRDLIVDARAL